MSIHSKIRLSEVVRNNKKWPLIIVGATHRDFKKSFVMPAEVEEWVLHQKADWETSLVGNDILLIDGMDSISPQEQEKFIPLLKDKKLGLYRVPDTVQIIMPVADKEKIASVIQSLSLIWELK